MAERSHSPRTPGTPRPMLEPVDATAADLAALISSAAVGALPGIDIVTNDALRAFGNFQP